MFGMFQLKNIGFKQIQRKKRLDRVLQLACIGTLMSAMGMALKSSVRLIAQATGQNQRVVSGSMLLLAVAAATIRKAMAQQSKQGASTTA